MKKREAEPVSAREAALKALVRVERDRAFLNLVLPPLLGALPPREKALALTLAAGTIQRLNTLDWSLELFLKRPLASLTPWIRNLLRLSAFQLGYLDRVPAHAAVNEAVRLAGIYGHRGVTGLVNAVLRRLAREGSALPWPRKQTEPVQYLALRHSHPPWMVERWISRFGLEEAEALCIANNEAAPVSLRPNRLRTGPVDLREKLRNEAVEAVFSPRVPGILLVKPGRSMAELKSFREGLFTVQGESSALVAPLLDPLPGGKVVDLCSAPGGKTTHLAELMNDRGLVTAVDIFPRRLRLVEKAASRLGLNCIETLPADGRQIERAGLAPRDGVLVDAPCTGLGVIRRLPELKWRRREADLARMRKRQLALLGAAAALLSPGGKLLYSVCSNEPEETVAVVTDFTAAFPAFTLLPAAGAEHAGFAGITANGTMELLPHRQGMDGFFMALWRR